MEVGLPLLGVLIALISMNSDLKDLDAEPIAVRIGQSVEVFHGGGVLDYYHTFAYGGCLGLHGAACFGLGQFFDGCQPIGLRIAFPVLVEV